MTLQVYISPSKSITVLDLISNTIYYYVLSSELFPFSETDSVISLDTHHRTDAEKLTFLCSEGKRSVAENLLVSFHKINHQK